jgi:hypothetical protein
MTDPNYFIHDTNGTAVTQREFNRFLEEYKEDWRLYRQAHKELKKDVEDKHKDNLSNFREIKKWLFYITIAVVIIGGSGIGMGILRAL